MLGKLTFLRERERAQKALGAKFDIRKFHDAMLLGGAVPLDLLDGITDRFIADARSKQEPVERASSAMPNRARLAGLFHVRRVASAAFSMSRATTP